MNERAWPSLESEWSQCDLHSWVRQMGINPDPSEVIPQGVKFIAWPQPPITENDIRWARKVLEGIEAGKKPLAVIPRVLDPRKN